ncbi:hypothetical protein KY310_03445 [Candidatus Woesearchaeota archaeon]|nr:hypothetical protein [Candidatus Woesearchaeota archaeon]
MGRIILPSQISTLETLAECSFTALLGAVATKLEQDEHLAKEMYKQFWIYLKETIPGNDADFSAWRRGSQRANKWDRYLLQNAIGDGAARQLGRGDLQVHAWYENKIHHLTQKEVRALIDDKKRWNYRFYEHVGCALMYDARIAVLAEAMQHIRRKCPEPKSG